MENDREIAGLEIMIERRPQSNPTQFRVHLLIHDLHDERDAEYAAEWLRDTIVARLMASDSLIGLVAPSEKRH